MGHKHSKPRPRLVCVLSKRDLTAIQDTINKIPTLQILIFINIVLLFTVVLILLMAFFAGKYPIMQVAERHKRPIVTSRVDDLEDILQEVIDERDDFV